MLDEDIKKIKNIIELSEKASKAVALLKKAKLDYLKDMDNLKIVKSPIEGVNVYLQSLIGDYWEFVDSCRELVKTQRNPLAEKAIFNWENKIFPLIEEVNQLIQKWNTIHKANIPTLEIRSDSQIRESYFGY